MAPMFVLRDDLPGISASAAASNQTSQIQEGNPTVDASKLGFIAPLVISTTLVIMLFVLCLW